MYYFYHMTSLTQGLKTRTRTQLGQSRVQVDLGESGQVLFLGFKKLLKNHKNKKKKKRDGGVLEVKYDALIIV